MAERLGITDTAIYKGIANKIRERLELFEDDEMYRPAELEGKIDELYFKGYNSGKEDGIAEGSSESYNEGYGKGYTDGKDDGKAEGIAEGTEIGVEQGKQAVYAEVEGINTQLLNIVSGTDTGGKSYYDEFWDAQFQYGYRTSFNFAFAGAGWNASNFKPDRDIRPTRADYMFSNTDNLAVDLVEHLSSLGIVLDFSKCTILSAAFRYSRFTRIGTIDTTSCSTLSDMFANSRIVTIDKLIVKSDGSTTFSNTFNAQTYLENITIEGVIGQNIDFKSCAKLSKASITNIVEHLSTTTSGLTVTFSKTAVETAFGSTDNAEWTALKNTRSNWTISLV